MAPQPAGDATATEGRCGRETDVRGGAHHASRTKSRERRGILQEVGAACRLSALSGLSGTSRSSTACRGEGMVPDGQARAEATACTALEA